MTISASVAQNSRSELALSKMELELDTLILGGNGLPDEIHGGAIMAQDSPIEWTEATWNPVTGCTKISPGCKHCYAERMAHRLQAMGQPRYRNGFQLTLQPDVVDAPLHWKRGRLIFVNSMSDLFHRGVPLEFIQRCFGVMEQATQHTFQILTKRPDHAAEIAEELPWPRNVWMGTSVENADYLDRIDFLRRIPAAVRFLSIEPLLGPIPKISLKGIQWVIVGGESGAGARPLQLEWVVNIREQCRQAEIPFFFKQWGGVRKSEKGRELDGRTYDELPPIRRGAVPNAATRRLLTERYHPAELIPEPTRNRDCQSA